MLLPLYIFSAPEAVLPAPTVSSVTPDEGVEETTTALVIAGANFVSGCTATLNGIALLNVVFNSSAEIECDTRDDMNGGPYTIRVTNPDTQYGELESAFTFTAPSVFDPATLSLTGWWRADYTASPWVGTASAGASGARELTEATFPPTVGTAQNALDPADFDGANHELSSADDLSTFVSAGAGSIAVLLLADAVAADPGAGSRVDAAALVGETGGFYHLTISAGGAHACLYDGGWKEVTVALATGAYHLAQMKHDGADLKLRVDSGAWSTLSAGNIAGLAGTLKIGRNYASSLFNGRMLEIMTAGTALSDGDFDGLVEYVNDRYALAL